MRETAGGPLTNDLLKCRLKPLDVADYQPAVLSASQLDRTRAVLQEACANTASRASAVSRPGASRPSRAPVTFISTTSLGDDCAA